MAIKAKFKKILRYFSNRDLYGNLKTSSFRIFNLKKEPIVVCGAPRSGTTLLTSILDSHPEICVIPYETMILLNRSLADRLFRSEKLNKYFTKFQINAILLSLPIRKTATRWCEKTPSNLKNIDYINNIYGSRVKFLHIVRDGRDVVLSHHDRMGQFMDEKKWSEFVDYGRKFAAFHNFKTVRYEDLLLNFYDTSHEIKEFLNLKADFTEEFYKHSKVGLVKSVIDGWVYNRIFTPGKLKTSSIGKWKTNLDSERVKSFRTNKKAKEMLEFYGYQ